MADLFSSYQGTWPAYVAVVDVETTGFAPPQAQMIEWGIVLLDDGKIMGEHSSLVRLDAGMRWDYRAQEVHGIGEHEIKDAPTLAAAGAQIEELLKGRIVVAHNAAFDRPFVAHAIGSAGRKCPPAARWLDTMLIMKAMVAGTSLDEFDSLEELGRWLGSNFRGAGYKLSDMVRRAKLGTDYAAHRALGDARATAQAYLKLDEWAGPMPKSWKW